MKKLSHFDEQGRARMVDISAKPSTTREAVTRASVIMQPDTMNLIVDKKISKGDVFAVARIAGIMAAKKCSELIPLCHPIPLTSIEINFSTHENRVDIEARVRSSSQTGVEMEALTAVSTTALTIYDMCKAVDRGMVITDIMVYEKKGGKSGHWLRTS